MAGKLTFRRGEQVGWWIGRRRATSAEVGAARPKCPNGGRHWFTAWQNVGIRKPYCDRCGAPNPYLTPAMLREYVGEYPDAPLVHPYYVADGRSS